MNEAFAKHVGEGLSATPKFLSSMYFYDEKGDELFMEIMNMPEYYLTDAEMEIFQHQSDRMIACFPEQPFDMVELGAGDGTKTIELLKKMKDIRFTYKPIDISENVLEHLEEKLSNELPWLEAQPLQGEYFGALKELSSRRKVILFLGSNIGNLTDEKARSFISQLADKMQQHDLLIMGVDLKKSKQIVGPAYNDAEGITARFNLNVLDRINSELDGDFDLEAFSHEPDYNEETGIASSYLKSEKAQTVTIGALNRTFSFEAGERIHTEISRKYDRTTLDRILEGSGLGMAEELNDSRNYFADFLLIKN